MLVLVTVPVSICVSAFEHVDLHVDVRTVTGHYDRNQIADVGLSNCYSLICLLA